MMTGEESDWTSIAELKQRRIDYTIVDFGNVSQALAWCLIFSVVVGSLF